ncbi:hypothetical protein S245_010404 [Arachis hypogaea]
MVHKTGFLSLPLSPSCSHNPLKEKSKAKHLLLLPSEFYLSIVKHLITSKESRFNFCLILLIFGSLYATP